jgi:hypothetical protein
LGGFCNDEPVAEIQILGVEQVAMRLLPHSALDVLSKPIESGDVLIPRQ